ncbi:tetratricopeptide repeat protein [bacterium]|nr:tetratricopeptide repeat protein [bacterium]
MKKAVLTIMILMIAVFSTACINNFAVQELNNKAKNYLDQGNYNAAISRLQASLDLDNTIFETHYNLGIACTNAEKYLDAIKAFNDAANLKPDIKDTYYSMAVAQENYARTLYSKKYKVKQNPDGTEKMELTSKDEVLNMFKGALSSYNKFLNMQPAQDEMAMANKQIDRIKTDMEEVEMQLWVNPVLPANADQ